MVDVAMVAAEAKVDSHGNTLPLNILEGSLVVASESTNDLDPVNVVISAGTYNAKLATCGAVCQTCNGCTGFQLNPNPFYGAVSSYGQLYSQCSMYTGSMYDYTNNSSFSSGNSGIFTVQSHGSSNPGLADGTGAGQTTGYTQILANPQTNAGQVCGGFSPPPCPTASQPQSNTTANVCGSPNGEMTAFAQWGDNDPLSGNDPAAAGFNQTLNPVNTSYAGGTVTESNASPSTDSCYFNGSAYPPTGGVRGSTWQVGSDARWGPDYVGWVYNEFSYYQLIRPQMGLSLPCNGTLFQKLTFKCPNGSSYVYDALVVLQSTISGTGITDSREGQTVAKTLIGH